MMEPLVDRPGPQIGRSSLGERMASCCSYRTLQAWLPILTWLPKYRLSWLQMDLIAGLTVGLTTVPQALAYAEVAGLPVQYGLYSAFMGGFIYTFLGTSKDVTLGPTAIMSLLCASYVGGDPVRAVLLSLICGTIQTAMALLRLGFLLDFISFPVIKGFTCAAAVTIGFGQVKNVLGLKDIPHEFFLQVYYTFYRIPETRIGDVVLGLLCLGLLVTLQWMKSTLEPPSEQEALLTRAAHSLVWGIATVRNALVVVAATFLAFSWNAFGSPVFTITGKTSQGLPPFRAPPLSETTPNGTSISFGEIIEDFGGGLAVIPFMGVLESIAIAKAFASQNDYRINANQELFAIGLTNIMGSFVSAYPVTGSFGRTAVNSQTGVCTPAGGIVTGVVVLLSLAFLMPAFYYIPKASLAAVIICAVAPLVDYRVVMQFWRIRKLDLVPFLITFLLSFWEVQYGIVGGVVVSGLMLLYNVARPSIKVCDHGVLVMELDSGLSFPSTEYLNTVLYTQALQASPPRSVVLDCHHVNTVDYTVVNELRDLLRQFKLRGVGLIFSGLQVLTDWVCSGLQVLTDWVCSGLQVLTDWVCSGLQVLTDWVCSGLQVLTDWVCSGLQVLTDWVCSGLQVLTDWVCSGLQVLTDWVCSGLQVLTDWVCSGLQVLTDWVCSGLQVLTDWVCSGLQVLTDWVCSDLQVLTDWVCSGLQVLTDWVCSDLQVLTDWVCSGLQVLTDWVCSGLQVLTDWVCSGLQVLTDWVCSDLQVLTDWVCSDLQVLTDWVCSDLQVLTDWVCSGLQVLTDWVCSDLQVLTDWVCSGLQVLTDWVCSGLQVLTDWVCSGLQVLTDWVCSGLQVLTDWVCSGLQVLTDWVCSDLQVLTDWVCSGLQVLTDWVCSGLQVLTDWVCSDLQVLTDWVCSGLQVLTDWVCSGLQVLTDWVCSGLQVLTDWVCSGLQVLTDWVCSDLQVHEFTNTDEV
ncbi:sodium-independent sulfate anion transporter isoform X25 [Oncorhynchus keta]|uniref:sodium-independent sulfate anion transporter isoform X25 n=1 Tax=Oncorhynchus keta TaxID=8018 RepID=UPI00227CDE73|nr:sodium-independent sulfate anion transporter isoform X25 [Oncorhynchus keta]